MVILQIALNVKRAINIVCFQSRRLALIVRLSIRFAIKKGVVSIPEGAWYDPDESGINRGGGPNVLTRDEPSPGGGFVTNTCLVQVEKAEENSQCS